MESTHERTELAEILERHRASVSEAMKIAGVSRRTIYNWINAGKVEFVRLPSGKVRIFVDTLFKAEE